MVVLDHRNIVCADDVSVPRPAQFSKQPMRRLQPAHVLSRPCVPPCNVIPSLHLSTLSVLVALQKYETMPHVYDQYGCAVSPHDITYGLTPH